MRCKQGIRNAGVDGVQVKVGTDLERPGCRALGGLGIGKSGGAALGKTRDREAGVRLEGQTWGHANGQSQGTGEQGWGVPGCGRERKERRMMAGRGVWPGD